MQTVSTTLLPLDYACRACDTMMRKYAAAGLARAARTGLLGKEALEAARRAFDGVVRSLEWDGEDLLVNHVCIGTGVGDYRFYCERPCSVNDLHGVGAFLLMCTELEEAKRVAAGIQTR